MPNTYNTKNSYKVIWDLHNIQINDNYKTISLDIKDLYVNLPVQNILNITEFWLKKKTKTKLSLTISYTSWR